MDKQIEEMTKVYDAATMYARNKLMNIICNDEIVDYLIQSGLIIPENAVVITREEYNELCCSIGVSREEVDRVVDMVEKDTRKETAEKFAERAKESAEIKALAIVMGGKLYPIYKAIVNKIDEICKEITEGNDANK